MRILKSASQATLIALTFLASACSDSGPSGASASLTGTWSYSVPAFTASGNAVVCAIPPTTIAITETSGVVTGSFGGGRIVCPAGVGPDTTTAPAGLVIAGALTGSEVSFTIDGAYWAHTATRAGNTMSGTATISGVIVAGATGTLSGTFTATRQ